MTYRERLEANAVVAVIFIDLVGASRTPAGREALKRKIVALRDRLNGTWGSELLTAGGNCSRWLAFVGDEGLHLFPLWGAAGGTEPAADLLPRSGLWIGLCEHFLLMLAISLGTEVVPAVGLLMGVKSVYRVRELDNRVKAEYYLLGTLLSISAAVVFGLGLRCAIVGGEGLL